MRTSTTPQFEIRIAVLGYVSAGKTTVINAILRDKYGEVAMRRTTAGVNHFRLTPRCHRDPLSLGNNKAPTKDPKNPSAAEHVDDFRSAESTLKEITDDNEKLRESGDLHVKLFDVEIDEPLCEMRDDTKLVLVDVPGINEAGADGKYREYVEQHWDTFDCVVMVVDGRQGANTEEQVNLFEFVRTNNVNKKDIPVIILCNKVDNPDDEEHAKLVQEAREATERIFKAPCPSHAIDSILKATGKPDGRGNCCSIQPPDLCHVGIHLPNG